MSHYLHQRLSRTLLKEMASGMYRDGQRFLSLRTIERLWKVSEPTVRSSLSWLAHLGVLRSEPRRGYFLQAGFQQKAQLLLRKNHSATLEPPLSLQQKARLIQNVQGGRIAVLLETRTPPPLEKHLTLPGSGLTPSVMRCATAFEKESRKLGFEPHWFLYDGGEEAAAWIRKTLETESFRGAAVFCRSSHEATRPMLEPMMQHHLPIVIMYDDCQGLPVNSININNVGIGYDAIRHLYREGHRKIAILVRRRPLKVHQARLHGCLLAQSEGVCADAVLKILAYSSSRPLPREVYRLFQNPAQRPTAVFATESPLLQRLLPLIEAEKLAIPDDLSLIVCSSRSAQQGFPIPLDTMHLGIAAKIGRAAARRLRKIQAGEALEKNVLLDVSLVPRGSVRPLAPASSRKADAQSAVECGGQDPPHSAKG